MNRNQCTSGFTLIELLLTLSVILPVLLAVIGLDVYVFRVTETSRQTVIAVQDAHTVIERIRNASVSGLSNVTNAYPDQQAVPGFNNLTGEQIVVDYADPDVDPLDVTVTVSWFDRQRQMFRDLNTEVTQK